MAPSCHRCPRHALLGRLDAHSLVHELARPLLKDEVGPLGAVVPSISLGRALSPGTTHFFGATCAPSSLMSSPEGSERSSYANSFLTAHFSCASGLSLLSCGRN